jgi:hypothetical protein
MLRRMLLLATVKRLAQHAQVPPTAALVIG